MHLLPSEAFVALPRGSGCAGRASVACRAAGLGGAVRWALLGAAMLWHDVSGPSCSLGGDWSPGGFWFFAKQPLQKR